MFRNSRHPPSDASPAPLVATGADRADMANDSRSLHESSLDLRHGLAVREASLAQLSAAEQAVLLGSSFAVTAPGQLGR